MWAYPREFSDDDTTHCAWIEVRHRRGTPVLSLHRAPIEVAPLSVIFQPSPISAKPRFSIHIGSYQLNGT